MKFSKDQIGYLKAVLADSGEYLLEIEPEGFDISWRKEALGAAEQLLSALSEDTDFTDRTKAISEMFNLSDLTSALTDRDDVYFDIWTSDDFTNQADLDLNEGQIKYIARELNEHEYMHEQVGDFVNATIHRVKQDPNFLALGGGKPSFEVIASKGDTTKEDYEAMSRVADRWNSLREKAGVDAVSKIHLVMDLDVAHTNCPIDFEKLESFGDGDFSHDIGGIYSYVNRETGELDNCFVPRSARSVPTSQGTSLREIEQQITPALEKLNARGDKTLPDKEIQK